MDNSLLGLLRALPRPLFFGITTGIALALFARLALPPLESIVAAGWPFATAAKYLGSAIAFMPAPGGITAGLFYLYLAYRNGQSGNP